MPINEKLKKKYKAFIDYSETIHDVNKNLEAHNPTKKRKVLIVFDDIIIDMEANKKIKSYSHLIVYNWKKSHHFPCFCIIILFQICWRYKTKWTQYFIMNTCNKRTPTNSTNVKFTNFMNPYKDYTKRLYFCSLSSRI